jgi:ribonuclease HI
LKLNVDGSFVVQTGEAGVGVVIRDNRGEVVLTAWRVLYRCASADEAEAQACTEGLRLASQWCPGPIVVESDSA